MKLLAPYDADFDLPRIARGTTAPSSPITGDVWIDTDATAAAAGAMTRIAQTVLASTATSISFTSIPATYETLLVVISGRSDRVTVGADDVRIRFNNDTAANYYMQNLIQFSTTVSGAETLAATSGLAGRVTAAGGTASFQSATRIYVPGYARTTFKKVWRADGGYFQSTATQGGASAITDGIWNDTSAITQVDLLPGVGPNFIAGTVATLYGVN